MNVTQNDFKYERNMRKNLFLNLYLLFDMYKLCFKVFSLR